MKNLPVFFAILLTILILGDHQTPSDKSQMVNPVIGDLSYESKFGHKPDKGTDNHLRIKTHLEYVEGMLREKDVSHLSNDLLVNRSHMLDLLHEYWQAGFFPKNYDYVDQRKPCFIDKDGTICAVGYLVEQTTNRDIAEDINSSYQYADLLAMNDQQLDDWIETSGLTRDEFAMIQPTYGPEPTYTYNHITPAYGISSSVWSGLNLSLITLNGVQMGKGTSNKTVPIMGLVSGAGQIALGSFMFTTEEDEYWGYEYSNESQKTLSMINIGLGTTAVIMSTWNLITNRKPKDKLTTWNVYSLPTYSNEPGLGFSMTRTF